MRIVHVSDTHLVSPGGFLFGIDPMHRLNTVLKKIETDFRDADLCIFSGDLADAGEAAAYEALQQRLQNFPITVRLMIGNHDSRETFRDVFTDASIDENGFVQGFDDIDDTRVIYLDSPDPGAPQGLLCSQRLSWLEKTLNGASDKSVLIFTHYPFQSIGLPHFQNTLLKNPEDVMPLLHSHGGVRHIFCGHAHVSMSGQWEGIPFTISAGTCHQIVPDFEDADARFVAPPPQFDVATITSDKINVHRVEVQDLPVLAVMPGV
jgi:3',5'-cyclic-AMP phosphodiesterase